MKPVIVVPTRGLIYAKTVQSILDIAKYSRFEVLIVDGLPMPDCFNEGVKKAMDLGASHIWFIEEDNEVPQDVAEEMIDHAFANDVVTLDYNVGHGVSHVHRDAYGEILWCGLGCTMIKRQVFEKIPYPWFEVDKVLNLNSGEFTAVPEHRLDSAYGGHDVLFFKEKAKDLGLKFHVLDLVLGKHYRAKELEKREHNKGAYTIYSL